jgi:hypothetical protein
MVRANLPPGSTAEEMLAELAAAACRAAGRADCHGALIDHELDLWYALQDRLGSHPAGQGPKGGASP